MPYMREGFPFVPCLESEKCDVVVCDAWAVYTDALSPAEDARRRLSSDGGRIGLRCYNCVPKIPSSTRQQTQVISDQWSELPRRYLAFQGAITQSKQDPAA